MVSVGKEPFSNPLFALCARFLPPEGFLFFSPPCHMDKFYCLLRESDETTEVQDISLSMKKIEVEKPCSYLSVYLSLLGWRES